MGIWRGWGLGFRGLGVCGFGVWGLGFEAFRVRELCGFVVLGFRVLVFESFRFFVALGFQVFRVLGLGIWGFGDLVLLMLCFYWGGEVEGE